MNYGQIPRFLVRITILTMFSTAFVALSAQNSTAQSFTPAQAEFTRELKDVLFEFDTHESPKELDILHVDAKWMKLHPQVRFYIEGYTDPRGDIVYNLVLGQRRADTVKKILLDMGISPERILLATGWGELYQTCQEQTEECWHRNRRVVFAYAGW